MPQRNRTTATLPVRLFLIAIASMLVMLLYELAKQSIFPHIGSWTSHTITIFFTSGLTTIAAYFVGRKLVSINSELEVQSAHIVEVNRKLAVESQQISLLSQMGE